MMESKSTTMRYQLKDLGRIFIRQVYSKEVTL